MSADDSITAWVAHLKDGDEHAARHIWERFFERAASLARRRLGGVVRRSVDEEDVAVSAMHALCAGARDGRFRRLENRDDLWQILAMITSRKAWNVVRAASRRPELGESAVTPVSAGRDATRPPGIGAVPDEKFVDAMTATCDDLLERLEPKLKAVALLKLEGFTNEEIAKRQERSIASIERYLKMIRAKWSDV